MLGWEEYLCLVGMNICAWSREIFVLGRREYLCLVARNICAWLGGIFVFGREEYLCLVERNICAWSRGGMQDDQSDVKQSSNPDLPIKPD